MDREWWRIIKANWLYGLLHSQTNPLPLACLPCLSIHYFTTNPPYCLCFRFRVLLAFEISETWKSQTQNPFYSFEWIELRKWEGKRCGDRERRESERQRRMVSHITTHHTSAAFFCLRTHSSPFSQITSHHNYTMHISILYSQNTHTLSLGSLMTNLML